MSKPEEKGSLKEVEQGELINNSNEKVPYNIIRGWDLKASLQCDLMWKAAWIELFEQIEQAESDESKRAEFLESISMEDMHWSWFDKAIDCSSHEYEWFYLNAGGKPQATCVIYHPKPSALEDGDIFYVEYVAVAPWNRTCKIRPREFKGLGAVILRAAQRFAVKQLKLRPGFCLHSLPKAEHFYTKLEMVKIDDKAKNLMNYFELPQILALKLMEA